MLFSNVKFSTPESSFFMRIWKKTFQCSDKHTYTTAANHNFLHKKYNSLLIYSEKAP